VAQDNHHDYGVIFVELDLFLTGFLSGLSVTARQLDRFHISHLEGTSEELLEISRPTAQHDAVSVESSLTKAKSKIRQRIVIEKSFVDVRCQRGSHGWEQHFVVAAVLGAERSR
jgi:hypothetical protein